MVSAPEKRNCQPKVKKNQKSNNYCDAANEIRKIRRRNQVYANRLPFKHLVKEFSKDLKKVCKTADIENIIQEASDAYVYGLFDGYSNICQDVAKRETDEFLVCLASLGLKELFSVLANDKKIVKAVKKSETPRDSLVPHIVNFNHNHQSHENPEANGNEVNQEEESQSRQTDNHHPRHHDHSEQSPSHHHHHHGEQISAAMRFIMRRISSNVSVSVQKD